METHTPPALRTKPDSTGRYDPLADPDHVTPVQFTRKARSGKNICGCCGTIIGRDTPFYTVRKAEIRKGYRNVRVFRRCLLCPPRPEEVANAAFYEDYLWPLFRRCRDAETVGDVAAIRLLVDEQRVAVFEGQVMDCLARNRSPFVRQTWEKREVLWREFLDETAGMDEGDKDAPIPSGTREALDQFFARTEFLSQVRQDDRGGGPVRLPYLPGGQVDLLCREKTCSGMDDKDFVRKLIALAGQLESLLLAAKQGGGDE